MVRRNHSFSLLVNGAILHYKYMDVSDIVIKGDKVTVYFMDGSSVTTKVEMETYTIRDYWSEYKQRYNEGVLTKDEVISTIEGWWNLAIAAQDYPFENEHSIVKAEAIAGTLDDVLKLLRRLEECPDL